MKRNLRGILFYSVIIFLIIGTLAVLFDQQKRSVEQKTYSDIVDYFNNREVKTFYLKNTNVLVLTVVQDDKESTVTYNLPSTAIFYEDLKDIIKKNHALQTDENGVRLESYDYEPPQEIPWWLQFVPYLVLIVIFVVMWFFLMNQAAGGNSKTMQFGKAKTRTLVEDKKKITFNDVAGSEEEKEELNEIVEFLKNPSRFTEIGARIPKGVLLIGPPGTGKTYLARAVAGEAGVPFLSISGSDFVEMFVGVGASRVRDLFDQAKKSAPAIVFIDEIDAVGRQRGAGLGGGHDEREQTLNQLLVEMDGFSQNEGVIIIAATNRPDILDTALLRPGRFDRTVYVGMPDIKAREAILRIHARGKPLEPNVDLAVVARSTGGFSPADLENLLNEAALLAARRHKRLIGMDEIQESVVKVMVGTEKKSRVVSEKERKLVAFHEAGHALATKYLPTQDAVHQISIIPRGRAGGYTLHLPSEDKNYVSKNEMFEDIVSLLGGRVAEQLVLHDISTGASNDIQRASDVARSMVTKYGMSDKIGPITYGTGHDEVFLGRDFATSRNMSERVAAEIDEEIKAIIDGAYQKCTEIISTHMDKLQQVAEFLIENEKMEADEFAALFKEPESPADSIKTKDE